MSIVWAKSYLITAEDNALLCPQCSVIDQQRCEHS